MNDNIWIVIWALGELNVQHLNTINKLSDRAVVNSVCGRARLEPEQRRLEEMGMWDHFVFPCVTTQPVTMAERVRHVLRNARLKPQYALFVSDNPFDRAIVALALPEINTLPPSELLTAINFKELSGYPDRLHVRLAQCKLSQPIDFETMQISPTLLERMGIECELADVASRVTQVEDLLKSKTVLNYTGSHITQRVLRYLLSDVSVAVGCVMLRSDFSDEMLAAFYAIKNGLLLHFFFDNSVANIPGVDQWAFAALDYPPFNKSPGCIGELYETPAPPWINAALEEEEEERAQRLFIRGSYEISGIAEILQNHIDTVTEYFPYPISINYATYKLKHLPEQYEAISALTQAEANVFSSAMFDGFDYVLISVASELSMQKFVWKEPDDGLEHPEPTRHIVDMPSVFVNSERVGQLNDDFYNKYESYVYADDDLDDALRDICGSLDSKTSLIIMTTPELQKSDGNDADYQRRVRYNKIAETIVREYPNAYLLDMRQLIKNDKDMDSQQVNEGAANVVLALMGMPIPLSGVINDGVLDDTVDVDVINKEPVKSGSDQYGVEESPQEEKTAADVSSTSDVIDERTVDEQALTDAVEEPLEQKEFGLEETLGELVAPVAEAIVEATDKVAEFDANEPEPLRGKQPEMMPTNDVDKSEVDVEGVHSPVAISFDMSQGHSVAISNIFKIIDFYIKNGYDVRLNQLEIIFGAEARIIFDERNDALNITLKAEMFSTIIDKLN
ncbi:MAG: hypothetical protein LBL96_07985 [Clostridiales bacterium]|jgi:hypothetical protein|nr:hypothetical protein [Clostridiales bacterium]